jgi:uncharacterized protein with HEPN domain
MRRETAKLLHDIADTCREIEQFSTGETLSSVLDNRGLQLALQKLVENAGEGLNRLEKLDPETALRIPDLRRYVDLRNRISRGYDSIDYTIVWRVVQQEVPNLLSVVTLLLDEAPPLSVPEKPN